MKRYIKGGNLFPKFNVGRGANSEPWGVRAIAIIDYWSRGPKPLRQLFYALSPFCAFLKR